MQINKYSTLAIATGLLLVSSLLLVEIRERLIFNKPQPDLERMISNHPDGWTAVSGPFVDPKWSKSLQNVYDKVAARTYQNAEGKTVGIVMTWSRDGIHRDGHLQHICYQCSGFTVSQPKHNTVSTKAGKLNVITFKAYKDNMVEDVMYWRVTGGNADNETGDMLTLRFHKLIRLAHYILGNTPYNFMVRVSSVHSTSYEPDTAHIDYTRKYLEILPDEDRKLIMGQ
ncbi:MAG: exosortase-associated EpsI family protein [Chlorobium sp.]|nr:MAG: exosortase-associated EpsI family protein [Chlorobium sp.]